MLSRIATSLLTLCLAAVMLSACDQQSESGSTTTAPTAGLAVDTKLAAIYQRSCKTCHANAASGAPLTGDSAAWAPRMQLGMDTLVSRVTKGVGGMPPYGMCLDCSPEQFEALITFMSSAKRQH